MLTWQEKKVFVYDSNLVLTQTLAMPKEIREGWGITHDDQFLYVTDGSSTIFVVNPETFKVINKMTVKESNGN